MSLAITLCLIELLTAFLESSRKIPDFFLKIVVHCLEMLLKNSLGVLMGCAPDAYWLHSLS